MSAFAALPAGSRLWDVEGIPVAEVPTPDGGRGCWAFDYPDRCRWFPFSSLHRNGAGIAPDEWDALVAVCHRGCEPWAQPQATPRDGLLRTPEEQVAYRAWRRKLEQVINPRWAAA
jgi:hypothetical protein